MGRRDGRRIVRREDKFDIGGCGICGESSFLVFFIFLVI